MQRVNPREVKRALERLYQYQKEDLDEISSTTSPHTIRLISLMIRGRHDTIVAMNRWLTKNVR